MSKQVTIKLGTRIRLSFDNNENDYLVTHTGDWATEEVISFMAIKFPVSNNTPSRFDIIIPRIVTIRDQKACTQPLKKISKAMHRKKMKSITQKKEIE